MVGTLLFARLYLLFSFFVLIGSTVFWSLLGARLQSANADQLINALLFRNPHSLQAAQLPSAHSFLLKWPLFFCIHAFGSTQTGLTVLTVLVSCLTVGLLAVLLWRIERRPLVLGTVLLALASALLLVPPVPSAGTLLPLNMAMLTTRNLEYIVFIFALGLMVRFAHFKNYRFWVGVLLLGILSASDKLFVSLAVGGALLGLIFYALNHGWNVVNMASAWLVGAVVAAAFGMALLAGVQALGITHIVSDGTVSPYGAIHSVHALLLGTVYGVIGLFTNFGANPAADTTVLHAMPGSALHHFFGFAGLALIVNICFFVLCSMATVRMLWVSIRHNKSRDVSLKPADRLGIALFWSTVAAAGVFVVSNHYYAADGRYLAVALFALATLLVCYTRRLQFRRPIRLAGMGCVVLIGMVLAVPAVVHGYRTDQAALAATNEQNALVASVVAKHGASLLVGDYWRVVPITASANSSLQIMPLQTCTGARTVLTSGQWQHDLTKTPFAYLLSLDGSLTDFPHCSLSDITNAFGRPNSSTVVAGSLSDPKELVLFYDHGAHRSDPAIPQKTAASTVTPVSVADYPYKTCNVPTVMNVVAHEDDDLLFMNPDLAHDIAEGHCVRTVYVTAGDAGHGTFYWLDRMRGSEAAYNKLLGSDAIWVERLVSLGKKQVVTIANPRNDAKIALIFMYLPDGNLKGQGFAADHNQSLARLEAGSIPTISSVYGGSIYTSHDIVTDLATLMHVYRPAEIRTQSGIAGSLFVDHSDHMAVGRFATKAYNQYEQTQFEGKVQLPVTYYRGYSGHELTPNVAGQDLAKKEAAFLAYTRFDGGACRGMIQCVHDQAYGAYLTRQYTAPY